MPFKGALAAAFAAVFLSVPHNVEAVGLYSPEAVRITALAGVEEPAVAQHLGKALRCDRERRGKVCYYRDGDVEVLFIGGLADWFTVRPRDIPYDPSSLAYLGLPSDKEPTFGNQHLIQWHDIGGVFEVTMYQGRDGKIEYFHVKARTP